MHCSTLPARSVWGRARPPPPNRASPAASAPPPLGSSVMRKTGASPAVARGKGEWGKSGCCVRESAALTQKSQVAFKKLGHCPLTWLKGAAGQVQALLRRRPTAGAAPPQLLAAGSSAVATAIRCAVAATAAAAAVCAARAARRLPGRRRVWRKDVEEAGAGHDQVGALPPARHAVPPLQVALPAPQNSKHAANHQ